MDPQTFLNNFATIAEAPGGVQRLRDLVLELAVRGRLVEQIEEDEPVAGLVERIDAVRSTRLAPLNSAAPISGRFDIPETWCWLPIERFVHLEMGQSPPSSEYNQSGDGMPFFQGKADFGRDFPVPRYWCTAPTKIAQPGDVLISVRAPVGPTNIADQECCVGRGLAALRPLAGVPTRFIRYLMQAFERDLAALGTGTTFIAISKKSLGPFPVPVPPLAEQERIVAKVDELMDLCDDLEARQQRRHRATTRYRSSALHALTEAESPDDLRHAWERASANWPALTGSEQSMRDLRQTVLELAVAGRLTTKLPDDGTADDLLRSATGLDEPCLVDSEGVAVADPHLLPPAWTWVTFGSILTEVLAGWSAPSTQQRRVSDEWAVLKVSACTWGSFRPEENKALKPGTPPREELEVQAGDFLITRANTSDLVARSVVVDATPPRLMLSDKTLRLTPIQGCNARYLNIANLASAARAHYRAEATGTSDSMKNVSQRAIRRTPIPLPPAPEQDRIVAVVDQLLQLIDHLAAALADQTTAAERLATAATG